MAKIPIYNFNELPSSSGQSNSLINIATQSGQIESSVASYKNFQPKESENLGVSLNKTGLLFMDIANEIKNSNDTAYAKDLVTQYSASGNEIVENYLALKKKDALSQFSKVSEDLEKLRKEYSDQSENKMVSQIYGENSSTIHNTLHQKMLKHSLRESHSYNVETQKSYVSQMSNLAIQSWDSYKEPDGEFKKYLTGTLRSANQYADLEGIEQNSPIRKEMLRKQANEIYQGVLKGLLVNKRFDDARELSNFIKKHKFGDIDQLLKNEENINEIEKKDKVATLSNDALTLAIGTKDITGNKGSAEKISITDAFEYIKKQKNYSSEERKLAFEILEKRIDSLNKKADLINDETYRKAEKTQRDKGYGGYDPSVIPDDILTNLTAEDKKRLENADFYKSHPTALLKIAEDRRNIYPENIGRLKPYLTSKDFLKYSIEGIELKEKNRLDDQMPSNELIKRTLYNLGVKQLDEEYRAVFYENLRKSIQSESKRTGKKLSYDEKIKIMKNILMYEAYDYGFFMKRRSQKRRLETRDEDDSIITSILSEKRKGELVIEYLGPTNKKFKAGNFYPSNVVSYDLRAKIAYQLEKEGMKPTLENIFKVYGQVLFDREEKAKKGINP